MEAALRTSYRHGDQESFSAMIWSIVIHLCVVLVLVINLEWDFSNDLAIQADVIDAVIVDAKMLDALAAEKQRQAELEKQRQAQIHEQQRQAKIREQQRLQEIEREEALRLAKQLEEQQALAEEKRRQEEQAKREAELKAEQERQQRLAEEQRLLEQAQMEEMQRLQAEEEAAAAKAQSQQRAKQLLLYKQAIKQRVDRNWIRPLSVENWYSCEVIVDQIPGGEVVNVQFATCDGDAVFQRSVRNAVYKSSPLPTPPDSSLFDRRINFTFKVPTNER